jgi:hypothetical protein
MKQKDLEKMINIFIADPYLKKASNYEKRCNFFDICNIYELKHSAFLAWLFNPKEAHGLGDFFIKELLKECIIQFENFDNQNQKIQVKKKKNWFLENSSIYDIDMTSYSETIIFTEFKAGKSKKNNGKCPAIDLALVNTEQELIIFVENKYGAPEGSDQTSKYYDYLNRKFGRKYDLVFVYLDKQFGSDSVCNIDGNWIATNYGWIQSSLKSILEQNNCNTTTEKILRDYYVHMSEDYDSDPYTFKISDAIKELGRKYHELLRELQKDKYQSIKKMNFEDIEKDKNLIHRKIYFMYKKYEYILDYMEYYSALDLLGDAIQEELKVEDDHIDIYNKGLSIIHPRFARWDNDNEWAPIDVTFKNKSFKNTNGDGEESSYKAQVFVYIDIAEVPEIHKNKVLEFIQKESRKKKINPRHNYIYIKDFKDKPKEEEIVEKMKEGYDKLQKLASVV